MCQAMFLSLEDSSDEQIQQNPSSHEMYMQVR